MRAYLRQNRQSYTGKTVQMVHLKGKWQPENGRYVPAKMGSLTVNVLCHDTDKDPPKKLTELPDTYKDRGYSNEFGYIFHVRNLQD